MLQRMMDAVLLRRRSLAYFFYPSGAERRLFLSAMRNHELLSSVPKNLRLDLGDGDLTQGLSTREMHSRELISQQAFFEYHYRSCSMQASILRPLLHRTIIWTVEGTMQATQQLIEGAVSRGDDPRLVGQAMFTAWGRIADLVFTALINKYLDYPDLLDECVALVARRKAAGRPGEEGDNFLVWLLLQLIPQASQVVEDELMFAKLLFLVPSTPPAERAAAVQAVPALQIRDLTLFSRLSEVADKALLPRKFPHPGLWELQGEFDRTHDRFEEIKRITDLQRLTLEDHAVLGIHSGPKVAAVVAYLMSCIVPTSPPRGVQARAAASGLRLVCAGVAPPLRPGGGASRDVQAEALQQPP